MKPNFKRYSPLAALILLLALLNITKFSVHANFSITEIWNTLLIKNELYGYESNENFYHVTNLDVYKKLLEN